jgi:hypothetical protein
LQHSGLRLWRPLLGRQQLLVLVLAASLQAATDSSPLRLRLLTQCNSN